ncbi:secretin N-terminal domain-containing protein [Allomesorhizobium camelthorni]|uniref:Nodulation protein NolW n=1 Tax=Allomesorhizobium camelthorni TaxID=475069 RepID=A0A6G4WHI8_9HYPH|nr:secretin N-terminal domain-containing protein [Mesorhizobium camelthorni]NGO54262.1 nodulation protein NolW [Mesorhizobium camelthorni]
MSRTLIRSIILHSLKGLLCVGFFLSTGIHATLGVPLSLPSTPYTYTVLDQDLSAALQEFGSNLNIRVNISAEVKGRIRGRMPDLPPREFLDRLTKLYDLQWYYDGLVLYVSAAKEAQTRMLVLTSIRFDAFKAALDELNISDDRYVVRPAPGNGLVLVSGPPRFIALVEQTFNGLVAEAQARPHVAAAPTRESVLILFRGSSTMVVRDGRPEASYSSDVPQQDGVGGKPELSQK